MFPKQQRLNLGVVEDRTIYKNKKIEKRFLRLFSRKVVKLGFKFGVSVPKKNVAKATDRNKIKRRAYSVIESHSINKKNIELLLVLKENYLEITDGESLFIKEFKDSLGELESQIV